MLGTCPKIEMRLIVRADWQRLHQESRECRDLHQADSCKMIEAILKMVFSARAGPSSSTLLTHSERIKIQPYSN